MEENERDGSSPSSVEDEERVTTSATTSFEMVALEEMNNSNRKNRDEAERNRKSNQTADDGEDHKKGKGSSHTALRRKRSGSGKGVGQSGGDDLQTSAQQGLRDDSSKAWVMRTLFRTAENERGPSRTRAKGTPPLLFLLFYYYSNSHSWLFFIPLFYSLFIFCVFVLIF
jgi:hypothetical protein